MNKITERKNRSTDSITIDADLIYHDQVIPLLDVSYVEYSVDGLTDWHKIYVFEDKFTRTSNDNKATWAITALVIESADSTFTDSPATATVGGIIKDTLFEGMTDWEFKHRLTHPFQVPTLSNFTSTMTPLVEVGTALTGTKTFSWTFTNGDNIVPLSGVIKENGVIVASGIDLSLGTVAVSLTIPNVVPISKSYTIEGLSTEGSIAPSNAFSLISVYPIFKGKYSSGNLTLPRPVASDIDITTNLNRSVVQSSGDLTVSIGSAPDDYDWVAIPTASSLMTNWLITSFNLGSIGGAVSPGGNLFPAPDTANLSSPNGYWATIPYRVYITNYPSAIASITFKRS